MGISNTFDISGSALNAQSISLDTIARNMANAQVVSGSENTAYRAKRPVFETLLQNQFDQNSNGGVGVMGFADSGNQVEKMIMPEHPMADADGYIYLSNVNMVEEMAEMIRASRSYQSNIEVLNTSKQLIMGTLALGK